MKKIILSAASLAVAAVASVSVVPTTAEAVPAFARQTGAACLNCHFQAIPRLAQMGREFRAGGFTDVSADLIEDDHLSLPVAFGASLLFKARMGTNSNNDNWDSNSSAAFQFPDEAALLMGGRVGEHTGALAEWAGGPLSYKLVHTIDAGAGTIGLVIASTDALGAAYSFNDPSNALIRNTRGSQFRPGFLKNSSIQQGVSGYGAYFSGENFHVGLAQFINNGDENISGPDGNAAMQLGQGLIYARAAYIGDVAGFDTVAGLYSISGSQNHTASGDIGTGTDAAYSETTTGVDVQLQGEIGDSLVGLYGVYQFNGTAGGTGFNLLGTYSVNHSTLVKGGYAVTTVDAVDTQTIILGAVYDVAQNFALDLEYAKHSGGKSDTTLLFEYLY